MSWRRLFHRRKKIPFAEWGCRVRDFHLPTYGLVQFAHWLHPAQSPTTIEQAEVDGLRKYIKPGDFAIDIGAQTGDTTVPMALAAGPTGNVLAVEPNPHVFKILEVNSALNRDKTRIIPRCFAATQEDGSFVFHYTDASYCNGGYRSQQRWKLFRRQYPLIVNGRNLLRVLREDYAALVPRLSYVKVDAEGYDRAILESIMPILRERRPVIRAEIYRRLLASERFALFDLLTSNGFDVFRHLGGDSPQGGPLTRRAMTSIKHFDVLAIPKAAALSAAA